jgi:2-(1,2-epoxy-1,2-dihydrophenyl)acetyl-CoA isomerase
MTRLSESVRVERDGGVVGFVFDRPRVRNALTDGDLLALADAVADATNDDTTRVIVLTAAGEHFCAGIDLPSVNAPTEHKPRTGHLQRGLAARAHRLILAMWQCQLPVVAAVRGHAAGVGAHLALAADFVVASRTAQFSEPFVRRALTPDSGGSFLLPRLVGVARAKELLLLGSSIDAATAYEWGLVTRLVDDAALETETDALVARLASSPTVALGLTKSLIHRSLESSLAQALEHEALAEELAIRSRDFKEGLAAFVEKRDPQFRGR